MFRTLLSLLALGIAGFCAYVAAKPSEYRIERSAIMNAPPETVFTQINSLKNFNEWSPWAKLDPQATAEFGGSDEGVGASFAWAGNNDVGKGSMTITQSSPSDRIEMNLEFQEPMANTATVEFLLKPAGEGTEVTWAIFGEDDFITKAICTFMDRDGMIGDMYVKGLANLKQRVEGS